MKILYTHPTGASQVRAMLVAFAAAGMLAEFHTSVANYPGNIWELLSRFSCFKDFERRKYDPILEPITHQHPARELGRIAFQKLAPNSYLAKAVFSISSVYAGVDEAVSERIKRKGRKFDAVYLSPNWIGSYKTLLAAKENGLISIFEMVHAHWDFTRDLLEKEMQRYPDWSVTLEHLLVSKSDSIRQEDELKMVDHLICPSDFVARSLPDEYKNKVIAVAPFGSPQLVNCSVDSNFQNNKKLRVLFVGALTQRKGLADLFEAINELNSVEVELVVMGSLSAPLDFYKNKCRDFVYEKGRSHDQVLKLMRSCDVFCLPSIVEGRALVMQEAMSQGLPLLITPSTGGGDLVEEGITGFIVPPGRPDLIASRIEWFVKNKEMLPEMKRAAQRKAGEISWQSYTETIIQALNGARSVK